MVSYKLIAFDGEVYTYQYYPEMDENHPGIIIITADGKRDIVKVSDKDFKNIYLGHAFSKLKPGEEKGASYWW